MKQTKNKQKWVSLTYSVIRKEASERKKDKVWASE